MNGTIEQYQPKIVQMMTTQATIYGLDSSGNVWRYNCTQSMWELAIPNDQPRIIATKYGKYNA